jgi:cellulose synthase/poly-beta-1,6-N-acetylglucosamine synthase-like glycosyltransferase
MKISYAIPVCNEHQELKRLLEILIKYKSSEDEIVILCDEGNVTNDVVSVLEEFGQQDLLDIVGYNPLNKDFASHKNYLTDICTGDYIFQIDADEYPSIELLQILPHLLKSNEVEVIRVPRINTVEGLTQEHINKWGWRADRNGWVNFPDYQWRIYKNDPKIRWKNKVHEVLEGYETTAELPPAKEYCLIHPKDIKRQEVQNNFYNTL